MLSTFEILPQRFASKGKEGHRTRMQHKIDRSAYPDSSLYETDKIQASGDPTVLPRHGIDPGVRLGVGIR